MMEISGYTQLSQEALQPIIKDISSENVRPYLLECTTFRTLPEKLLRYASGSAADMKETLNAGFKRFHTDPKERDSLRKLLNAWFTAKPGVDDRTISREYAFEMCFILGLSSADAEEFIVSVTGEGIHYRNPEEFTKAYCLLCGKSYEEYTGLLSRVKPVLLSCPPDESAADVIKYTQIIKQDLQKITTDEEFLRYIQNNIPSFRESQSTAYAYFSDMLNVLMNEGTDASVSELVAQNLYRRYLPEKKVSEALLKSICAGWPDETQISRMRNHKSPVTRKALILLFLASCGGISLNGGGALSDRKEDEWLDDDPWDEEDEENNFDGMFIQMNAMLRDCGFSPMDPRHPFDWIVLFCMSTGDIFDIDERFNSVLKSLFGNEMQS